MSKALSLWKNISWHELGTAWPLELGCSFLPCNVEAPVRIWHSPLWSGAVWVPLARITFLPVPRQCLALACSVTWVHHAPVSEFIALVDLLVADSQKGIAAFTAGSPCPCWKHVLLLVCGGELPNGIEQLALGIYLVFISRFYLFHCVLVRHRCHSYGIPMEVLNFWYLLAVYTLGCISLDILMGWNLSFLFLELLAEYMGAFEGDG